MFLTPAEIEELTGRERCNAQRRALEYMGVPYRLRPDKSVVVLRSALENAPTSTRRVHAPELQP